MVHITRQVSFDVNPVVNGLDAIHVSRVAGKFLVTRGFQHDGPGTHYEDTVTAVLCHLKISPLDVDSEVEIREEIAKLKIN